MTTIVKPKERPVLFSGPMVRAILDGRKSQTRRIVKPQPSEGWSPIATEWYHPCREDDDGMLTDSNQRVFGAYDEEEGIVCPYGGPGDHLWVRETWNTWGTLDKVKPIELPRDTGIGYAADMNDPKQEACGKLRPSIFLPRWASRITLEITGVRVERLQEISEEDAIAEGCIETRHNSHGRTILCSAATNYRTLWEQINGAGSWDANPFVWCIEFKRVN